MSESNMVEAIEQAVGDVTSAVSDVTSEVTDVTLGLSEVKSEISSLETTISSKLDEVVDAIGDLKHVVEIAAISMGAVVPDTVVPTKAGNG